MKPYRRCRYCGVTADTVPISKRGACPPCALERSAAQAAGAIGAAVTAKDLRRLEQQSQHPTSRGG